MRIGGINMADTAGHVHIMGILNLTPDSFSDGGKYTDLDRALTHTEEMLRDGAEIIDLGAESTRPGYIPVSAEEEACRLVNVLREIKKRFDAPVSVDTYKARVMDAVFSEGADLGNDIWGFRYEELHPEELDPDFSLTMAEVVAKHGKPVVLMQNDLMERQAELRQEAQWQRSGISARGREDVLVRVRDGLARSLEIAAEKGIGKDRILLDPGVGFAKTLKENRQVLAGLGCIRELGCPMLLGASRKSVIGDTLQLPPEEREEGTLVTSILAAQAGYGFVRVHDVRKNRRALDFYERIMEERGWYGDS